MLSAADRLAFLQSLTLPDPTWQGTGATPLSVDPRDYDIRWLPGVADQLAAGVPASADLTGLIKGAIYNQGNTGACVAYSTAGLCSMDDVAETGQWTTMDAAAMYAAAGGTGQNGVDSRLVLQQATDNGVPILGVSNRVKIIKSYAFVPQQPGIFRDTLKAAIAAGYPLVVALLLPSDWGWMSGHGAATTAYHQVVGCGYTSDGYLVCLNSWGAGWSRNGIGSVRFDYLEQNNLLNQYVFSYTVTPLGVTPPPPPPPPGVLTVTGYDPNPVAAGALFTLQGSGFARGITASFQGQGLPVVAIDSPTLLHVQAPALAVTTTAPVSVSVGGQTANGPALTVTTGGPAPPPPPPPGGLVIVATARLHGRHQVAIWAAAEAAEGDRFVAATISGTVDGQTLPPKPAASTGYPAVWIAPGQRGSVIHLTALSVDGMSGAATLIV